MEQTKPFQGFLEDDPTRFVIRKAGIFLIRDEACTIEGFEVIEPYHGRVAVYDADDKSGNNKIIEMSGNLCVISEGRYGIPAALSKGLTVVTTDDCHIVVRSFGKPPKVVVELSEPTTKHYQDEVWVSPGDFADRDYQLQQDARGSLLCRCPNCGDEWRVSTWPKLEANARAEGFSEAMKTSERDKKTILDSAHDATHEAFRQVMRERGMFGIRPHEDWIEAIWEKDFAPILRKHYEAVRRCPF